VIERAGALAKNVRKKMEKKEKKYLLEESKKDGAGEPRFSKEFQREETPLPQKRFLPGR